MSYPVAPNEEQRLRAVADLRILDTPRDAEFDALVDLAREMLGAQVSLISVLDKDRQWFKAAVGIDVKETPRNLAFCNHTIVGRDPFVVEDARCDPRFAENPLVTGAPHIRSYAGVPLFLEDGFAVGSLCIINSEPWSFTDWDLSRLRQLGDVATSLLRQYRNAERVALLRAELTARHDAVARRAVDLEVQKRIFKEVSSLAKLGAWTRDLQTGSYEWSDEMYALHEVDPDFELTDGNIASLYPPEEFRRLAELNAEAERTRRPFTFEGEMVTAKGNSRHVRISAQFQFEDGVAVRRYGTVQDITQERTRADEMARLAQHDSLTGLYNRSFVQDHLRSIPGQPETKRGSLALLLLDLDGFKDINDSHGHAAGDHCLKVVANRLTLAASAGPLVARLGGDEFAVLLEGTSVPGISGSIAASIIDAVAEPIQWMGYALELTTSIGIAHGTAGSGFDPDRLLLEADLALYAAKEAGRNRLLHFDNSMKVSAYQRFLVLENIKNALKDGQLELHYQPKVKLVDGRCYSFEALIRWNSPDGRVVAPGAFAEALVDPKLGVEVGDFVIRAALDQAEAWAAAGVPFGSIAINLSSAQFRDTSVADFILREIAVRGLPARMIEVEVTEGVFLSKSSETVLEVCRKLKQNGVRIAFDDFGTGFASLTHLTEFPVDIIKIDRSFVSTLDTQVSNRAIVNAIVGMCRALGLEVVAEGVETEAQAEFLRAGGCCSAQGYLFARPLPARCVAAWLDERNRQVA